MSHIAVAEGAANKSSFENTSGGKLLERSFPPDLPSRNFQYCDITGRNSQSSMRNKEIETFSFFVVANPRSWGGPMKAPL